MSEQSTKRIGPSGGSSQAPTVVDTPIAFGRYQVIRHLASGGMGAVYLARDGVLARDVAVKSIRPVPGKLGQEFSARFLVEARCVASLKHPNVVPIFDLGLENESPYIVMEVVEGPSLGEAITQSPFAARQARIVGIQIANALAEAHRNGIVHRDVKPANILRAGPDTWKLVDFGVAQVPDSSLTSVGDFLGTPAYAAPESLEGGGFSPASDVYGLAATLFHVLSGAPPHGTGNAVNIAVRASTQAAPSIGQLNPSLSPDLVGLIDQSLSREPARRPSAAEFAEQLASARADSKGVLATPAPSADQAQLATADTAFHTGGKTLNSPTEETSGPVRSRVRPALYLLGIGALVLLAVVLLSDDGSEVAPVQNANAVAAAQSDSAHATIETNSAELPAVPSEAPTDEAVRAPLVGASAAAASSLPPLGSPETNYDGLQEVKQLIARKAITKATRSLDRLRKAYPKSAYLSYLQGSLYMDRRYRQDGFEAYRSAIARDARYKAYPPLIEDAIGALASKSQPWRAANFLEQEVGAPARPHLEQALQRTTNPKTRSRIASLLKKIK